MCLEDIHTSRTPCHIPGCGHLLHRTCFKELLQSGHYACPTCQVSLLDMTDLWKYLDAEVSLTPMPEEYKDYKADILCKDCHEVESTFIHISQTCLSDKKDINGRVSVLSGIDSEVSYCWIEVLKLW